MFGVLDTVILGKIFSSVKNIDIPRPDHTKIAVTETPNTLWENGRKVKHLHLTEGMWAPEPAVAVVCILRFQLNSQHITSFLFIAETVLVTQIVNSCERCT